MAAALTALQAVRDPEGQFATAFEALDEILRAAGSSLTGLVDLTTFHVDLGRHLAAFTRVKDRYVRPPYPAWTAIGVAELVVPGGLVELRAVALAPGPEIDLADLPEAVRSCSGAFPVAPSRASFAPPPGGGTPAAPLGRPLARAAEEAEIARIVEALRKHNNNRLRAAAELGISRMALYKKLHKYDLFRAG